jgi:hypothetical protein
MIVLMALTAWAADLTWNAEYENALYNTPAGWATTQKSGAVMLIPPDLKEGEQAAIVIPPGGDLKGEFKDALVEFRGQLRGDAKATESPTQSANADEGYPILYVAEQIKDDAGTTTQYRYFLASHPGNRVEFVLLVANSEDAYKRYTPAFEEFVKTLAYKNVHPGAHATSAPSTNPTTQP